MNSVHFSNLLLVGIGGCFGAVLRFTINNLFKFSSFPFATLTVNVVGSFLLGFFIQFFKENHLFPELNLVFAVGVLGAFTTFSTFSLETVHFLRSNNLSHALFNILLNLALCFVAVFFGDWLGNFVKPN